MNFRHTMLQHQSLHPCQFPSTSISSFTPIHFSSPASLTSMALICFVLSHPDVLKDYYWLCAQGLLLGSLRKPYGLLEIKYNFAVCKANDQLAIYIFFSSFWPAHI